MTWFRVSRSTERNLRCAGAAASALLVLTASASTDVPRDPSPVDLRCERIPSGAPRITIRNRTAKPLEVALHGLAYAGQSRWERWWVHRGIRLAPRGMWTAILYEVRGEKVEVRDRHGRLLADRDLRSPRPVPLWTITALNSRSDWRPFDRAYGFGESPLGPLYYVGRTIQWRTVTPAELPPHRADFLTRYFRPVHVIGDVRAEALAAEQLRGLRLTVESGRTLVVCGGTDRARLTGWEHAGLLAAPVRGVRTLPGFPSLAERYGVGAITAPIPVMDVGTVRAPARVLLEEGGTPLVVARPLGLGTLLLLTFDPTRRPFRGSALEKPFWQEWSGRGEDLMRTSAMMEEAKEYRQLERRLGMLPPSAGVLAGFWLAYLGGLVAILRVAHRRIAGLVTLSLAASAAALALGPMLRSAHPVAAFAGLLHLRSGEPAGVWRGEMDVMMPTTRLSTLRVTDGAPTMFVHAPLMRLGNSQHLTVQPLLEQWSPLRAWVSAVRAVPGSVTLESVLSEDGVFVEVRNGTPYVLRDAAVIWNAYATLRLGDLPPGGRARRLVARVAKGGVLQGKREGLPDRYGRALGFGNSLETGPKLLFVARCPQAPLPRVLADERPLAGQGLSALLVAPNRFRLHETFQLPAEAVTPIVVRLSDWALRLWVGQRNGGVPLSLAGRAVTEIGLPEGGGAATWKRLSLEVDGGPSAQFRVGVFDWEQQQWVAYRIAPGHRSVPLSTPQRFVNRQTDSMLVRVENASGFAVVVKVAASGEGQAPS